MILQRFILKIPTGITIAEVEEAIIDNKYLIKKMEQGELYGQIVKSYIINGEKTLLPILPDDNLRIERFNFKGSYIDILFELEGSIEKIDLTNARAVLRGNFDLRQEKLNIIGVDLLVQSTDGNLSIGDSEPPINEGELYTTLEIRNKHGISAKEIYENIYQDPRIRELLRTESFYGEISGYRNINDFYQINMNNITHRIIDIHKKGDKLEAEVKIFNKDIDLSKAYLVPRIVSYGINKGMKIKNIITFDINLEGEE